MDVPEELQSLFVELGKAIDESIQGSERIPAIVQQINNVGYHVQMLLEVTIGFTKEKVPEASKNTEPVTRATWNEGDADFLRLLRISPPDPKKDNPD